MTSLHLMLSYPTHSFPQFPLTAVLSPEEAQALIMTLLVTHSVASDLTGLPLDWTQPIVTTLLTLA